MDSSIPGAQTMVNMITTTKFNGTSGFVSFDEDGDRNLDFELVNVREGNWPIVAYYDVVKRRLNLINNIAIHWMSGTTTKVLLNQFDCSHLLLL